MVCVGFVVSSFLLVVSVGNAEVLFTEIWDTNSIGSEWVVKDTDGGDIIIEDISGNGSDYALALKGYQDGGSPVWNQDHIYSAATFARGGTGDQLLRITYSFWYKSGINVQTGVHGGWHWANTGPIYGTIEAAVDYVFSSYRATEDQDGLQNGPPMTNLNTAWGAANGKNSAIRVRTTLDPSQGAKWEISTDNGQSWITERNTLGTGGSLASNCYVGFGPFDNQAGTTLIDDIVVEYVPKSRVDVIIPFGGINVSENGDTDTYEIVCAGSPTQNVIVTVEPDDQLQVNDAGQGNPIQLTFTPADANTPQTVTVAAIDDTLQEGNHTGVITHTSSSTDTSFNGLAIIDVIPNITDNEHFCGEPGQVYNVFDVTGPVGVPDCYVDFYDFAAFAEDWLSCTDLSDVNCSW